jgi:hypothetical protein
MAEQKPTKKEYRLTAKAFSTREDGALKVHAKGAIVLLSDSQYAAFKDQFEPKDAAAQKAKETASADAKQKAAEKETADATAKTLKAANAGKAGANDEAKADEPTAPEAAVGL